MFEELVVSAVTTGDLAALKKCSIRPRDVDRRLLLLRDIAYTPKYNPRERYIQLRGPTITMLSILCEQEELLDYILTNLSPDLSVRIEGYTALHLAAMVRDYRPLRRLLQCAWVQENIDLLIEMPGTQPASADFTTALHAAVSNRRIYNVFLLLSEFHEFASANVDQRSAAGSTPLYIAAFLGDANLVEVLLSAGADATVVCASGLTALDVARRRRDEDVCRVLESAPDRSFEMLKTTLAPELIPPVALLPSRPATPAQPAGDGALGMIIGMLAELGDRMARLEGAGLRTAPTARVERRARPPVGPGGVAICSRCGSVPADVCAVCHRAFCQRCGRKAGVHTGCVE
jgi:hypothetical protein